MTKQDDNFTTLKAAFDALVELLKDDYLSSQLKIYRFSNWEEFQQDRPATAYDILACSKKHATSRTLTMLLDGYSIVDAKKILGHAQKCLETDNTVSATNIQKSGGAG